MWGNINCKKKIQIHHISWIKRVWKKERERETPRWFWRSKLNGRRKWNKKITCKLWSFKVTKSTYPLYSSRTFTLHTETNILTKYKVSSILIRTYEHSTKMTMKEGNSHKRKQNLLYALHIVIPCIAFQYKKSS